MAFDSFAFAGFFVLFLLAFFGLPRRLQPLVVLAGSYAAYASFRPVFALLLLSTTLVDYAMARVMQASAQAWRRRAALALALMINLGVLLAVKFIDFRFASRFAVGPLAGQGAAALLPVGVSFYTLQSVGYAIDVYARRIQAERSLLTYAQFVAFFPQLMAGPIERAGRMLPQFRARHALTLQNLTEGAWLIGYGLFKKLCVADLVFPFVNRTFAEPIASNGSYSLVAVLMFALEIYCDFSGYSSIARGLARILGFELMVNFRQPYFSTSLAEFWRRWHISLSSWLRDYLYIPLGGDRVGWLRWALNVLIVFLASGLWHGAAVTFLIWGAFHGAAFAAERLVRKAPLNPPARLAAGLGWVWTMAVVTAGWMLFRAPSLQSFLAMARSLAHPGPMMPEVFEGARLARFELVSLVFLTAVVVVVDALVRWREPMLRRWLSRRLIAWPAGLALIYAIVMFGVFGRIAFIYFQF
jgi:D-alanyl-lipoteichoic acid acyltransferase DltB (MBOAT superfamily)